jgi:hypothetical protein
MKYGILGPFWGPKRGILAAGCLPFIKKPCYHPRFTIFEFNFSYETFNAISSGVLQENRHFTFS